jgi:hypothetical protein
VSGITHHVSRVTYHVSRITFYVSRFFKKIDLGLVIAALLTLFIIQNFLQPGLPTVGDMPIHLYRTMEYKRAWVPGVIVPRWASNFVFGYGYPLFVFAPPLPYLLGLAFHSLGFTFEAALKALIILTILLYAIGMYLLARDVLGSVEAGLVAATAYAFAPFALREALLYGGNVPQLLAIGLFPWTLWAMTRAAYPPSWKWVILAAIFYAGVMLSHLFHVFVFTPVVGLYGLILFWLSIRKPDTSEQDPSNSHFFFLISRFPDKSKKIIVSLLPLLSIPIGFLLSAFFWIPAFTERYFTRAQADIFLERSPFYVRYPHWTELIAWIQPLDARAANPYVPLTLGVITLGLAGFGLLTGVWWRLLSFESQRNEALRRGAVEGEVEELPHSPACSERSRRAPVLILFFALVAAAAVFLTLPVSRPVWDMITLLQLAEFPWRWLGLANLGLAFLAGAAMLLLPAKVRRFATILCLLIQIVAVAPYLYPVTPFAQYGQSTTIADQIDYERRSQSIGTTGLSEYLPQTVSQPPTTSPLVETFQAGQLPERLDRDSLPSGAIATLLKQDAVTHIYDLDSPVDFTLRLFHYDYPGWRAWLDDQPVNISPEPDTGFMLINIPAGQYTLKVRFGETPGRMVAMFISGLTVIGLVIARVSWRSINKGKRAEEQESRGGDSSTFNLSKIMVTLLGCGLIIISALWLKPWLCPVFTVQSPPGQALPAQYKTNIDFTNGIRLIGYDLNKTVVSPGGYLQVVLYWETDAAPIKANLQPFVHLDRLNDWSTIADATNYTPGDVTAEIEMPTFHWDNARYVRDEHDLLLAPTTPPLAYAVRVGLIDPDQEDRLLPLADGSGDTAQLTIINVSPSLRQQLHLAHQLDIALSNNDDTIHLTGFEVGSLTPERLDFTLAWQSDQTPQRDYTVFAQLLDVDQNLVASFDRPPLDGAYPTSTWLPGQTIIDPRYLPLGDVAPGNYRLIVGLYDSVTRERLTTGDGANFVELSPVAVSEP